MFPKPDSVRYNSGQINTGGSDAAESLVGILGDNGRANKGGVAEDSPTGGVGHISALLVSLAAALAGHRVPLAQTQDGVGQLGVLDVDRPFQVGEANDQTQADDRDEEQVLDGDDTSLVLPQLGEHRHTSHALGVRVVPP
jgi:hypothetical protein